MNTEGEVRAGRAAAIAQAERRAPAVVAAVLVAGLAAAVAVGVGYWRIRVLDDAPPLPAYPVPPPPPHGSARTYDWVAKASDALFPVAGLVWLWWFGAVAATAVSTGRLRVAYPLLAWLIPVVNLIVPKRVVDQVWRAGAPPGKRPRIPRVVNRWWALFVAAQLSPLVVVLLPDSVLGARNHEVGELQADLARRALLALAAPLAVRTVLLLTRRLRRIDEVAGQSAGVQPPSTGTTQPVTYDAAGDSRNAATRPNSAGSP